MRSWSLRDAVRILFPESILLPLFLPSLLLAACAASQAQKAPLSWPFPGNFEAQRIFNNYQEPMNFRLHAGLDFAHPAGTTVKAVSDGWVYAIDTYYPEWDSHYFVVLTTQPLGKEGWCYTHLDPHSILFQPGDYVKAGQDLGKLSDFSNGAEDGPDHLHLSYVRTSKTRRGKTGLLPIQDPLTHFDWKDEKAPIFSNQIYFTSSDGRKHFQAENGGLPIVSGKVDIVFGIYDAAPGFSQHNWMVPEITLEIHSPSQTTWKQLVLNQRGRLGELNAARSLYLAPEQIPEHFKAEANWAQMYFVVGTHTDNDGLVEAEDALHCWDTAARSSFGNPQFPDGVYRIRIEAVDLKGNRSNLEQQVRVANSVATNAENAHE